MVSLVREKPHLNGGAFLFICYRHVNDTCRLNKMLGIVRLFAKVQTYLNTNDKNSS